MPGSIIGTVADTLTAEGLDLAALGLAWARAMPSVVLVPAFGLRALPVPARAVFGLALAVSIFPALQPAVVANAGVPWVLVVAGEALRGLPIALAATIPLWAATMAGGVADALRGTQFEAKLPIIEGTASPMGALFSILASLVFLASGGPSRIAAALSTQPLGPHPLLAAARDLENGITIAVAVGAPLLVASIVVEVANALIARASRPAFIQALLAPARALGVLVIAALVFDRIQIVLARAVLAPLP